MLISFDIDGTMVFGDPPGEITVEDVRKVKELGFIVGSASDRPRGEQSELWHLAGIELDFISLKHRLAELKQRFMVKPYVHVGDTLSDKMLAKQAGFDFVNSSDLCREDFFHLLTGEVSLGPERKA